MSVKKLINNKFGYDVSGLSAYVEQNEGDFIEKSVTGAPTLMTEGIRIEDGIKGTERFNTMDVDVNFQDASSCGLTPDGDLTIGQFDLTVHRIGQLMEFCNEDLVGKFLQRYLPAGAMNQDEEMPFEQAFTDRLVQLLNFEVEKLIWRGDSALSTGNLQFFNGWKTIFDASGSVNELNSTGVTSITSSNAFDTFFGIVESMAGVNEGIVDSGEMIIYTDRTKYYALLKNMLDLNLFNFDADNERSQYELNLYGTDVKVRVATGLNGTGNGGIYTGKRSDFTFGTDLQSDLDQFKVWYSDDDDKIKFKYKFRAGVTVPFEDQIGKFTLASS